MYEPTEEQRANLAKLADYLANLPKDYKKFDMGEFRQRRHFRENMDMLEKIWTWPNRWYAGLPHVPLAMVLRPGSSQRLWNLSFQIGMVIP